MLPRRLLIILVAIPCLVLWGKHTLHLQAAGTLDFTPNFACLGGSPYGKTLAFAVQDPVDAYWHASQEDFHDDHDGHHHDDEHGHVHDENCTHNHEAKNSDQNADSFAGRAKTYVKNLSVAKDASNMAEGQTLSPAHKHYLRAQVERGLRAAYWLDPCNYTNYNALHLFLFEDDLAPRKVSLERVLAVANRTQRAAEAERVNPEPWLTAAAAALSKLETLQRKSLESPNFDQEMEKILKEFEFCLSRYEILRKTAVTSGTWDATPQARKEAMELRSGMLRRFYENQRIITRDRLYLRSKNPKPKP